MITGQVPFRLQLAAFGQIPQMSSMILLFESLKWVPFGILFLVLVKLTVFSSSFAVASARHKAKESNPKQTNGSDAAKQRALFSGKAKPNPRHPLPRHL